MRTVGRYVVTVHHSDELQGAAFHRLVGRMGSAMRTRKHIHEETFPVERPRLFALLHTPSAIRQWWGAAQAVVLPEAGGKWAAAWGEAEDDPDYVTVATIREFQSPHRMVLSDYRHHAKTGPLPFEIDFVTEFLVSPHSEGASLRVTQDGLPVEPEGDTFYAGCEKGWKDTVAGIRQYRIDSNRSD